MRWGLLVLVSVAWCGVAVAEPTRKVDVVTDPPGATIYVGDLDAGEACKATPCSVNVPAGKRTAVIARKDGYGEEFVTVDLRKGGVKNPIVIKMTASSATLVCDDPGLAGGTIVVDEVEKGTAPAHVPIETEGHHVVVTVKGHVVFDDYIKVDPNQEYVVKPNKSEPAPQPPHVAALEPTPSQTPDDGDPSIAKTGSASTKPVIDEPREPWIAGGGVLEVGFRQFAYRDAKNLPPTEREGGQVLVGPSLQLWPTRLVGADVLRGLSVYGKVAFGANHKAVLQDPAETQTGWATFWGNIEVDLQYRWNIGDSAAIEISGGYVRDQVEYTATDTKPTGVVPFADYGSVRVGVRGTLRLGPIEPYLQVEGRDPFSHDLYTPSEVTAPQFTKTSVLGAGAAAGLAATFGPVVARLEASIVYYDWTLTSAAGMSETATGARDVIEGISLLVGVAY